MNGTSLSPQPQGWCIENLTAHCTVFENSLVNLVTTKGNIPVCSSYSGKFICNGFLNCVPDREEGNSHPKEDPVK